MQSFESPWKLLPCNKPIAGPARCHNHLSFHFISHLGQKYSNGLRFTTIVLCGTLSVMGSKYLDFKPAGALGCITAAFTAGTGWKNRKAKDASFNSDVELYLNLLWKFLKPVSFSLIGKEVNFQVLEGNMVAFGLLALLAGVVFRVVSSYASFCGGNMNWKEKAYITLSGFPKATGKYKRCSFRASSWLNFPTNTCLVLVRNPVQAAIGPVALDLARAQHKQDEQQLSLAQDVLLISVLAIIATAPLGK